MRTVSATRNRVLLFLIGLVLLLVGAGAALLSAGVLAQLGVDGVPEGTTIGQLVEANSQWLYPTVIALLVIGVIIGLWGLFGQVPTKPHASAFRLSEDPQHGQLSVETGTLETALEEQLEGISGVTNAKVNLSGSASQADLIMRVTISADTSVQRVVDEIYSDVVNELQYSLGNQLDHVGLEVDARAEPDHQSRDSVRQLGEDNESSRHGHLVLN